MLDERQTVPQDIFRGSSLDVVYGASQSFTFSDLSFSRTRFKILLKYGLLSAIMNVFRDKMKQKHLSVFMSLHKIFCFDLMGEAANQPSGIVPAMPK